MSVCLTLIPPPRPQHKVGTPLPREPHSEKSKNKQTTKTKHTRLITEDRLTTVESIGVSCMRRGRGHWDSDTFFSRFQKKGGGANPPCPPPPVAPRLYALLYRHSFREIKHHNAKWPQISFITRISKRLSTPPLCMGPRIGLYLITLIVSLRLSYTIQFSGDIRWIMNSVL